MRKVRCVRGHFYDADMNVLCPHCGSPEGKDEKKEVTQEEIEEVSGTKSKKGRGLFFGKKANKKSREENDMNDIPMSSVNKEEEEGRTEKMTLKSDVDEKKTHSFWIKEENFREEMATTREEMDEQQERIVVTKQKQDPRDIDSIKTVSKYAGQGGVEPVTGWLVCIKGENFGKAYEIKAGQSSIGRDSSMNICIKEEGITREKHAFIIFEPKKRQFFLRGGDGSGLTYCNEEMVTGMVTLNIYDKVQLGDAEFLFIPFCGEHFMWEEK